MKKFITIAAAAAFLFMGNLSASAQNSSELQNQIDALLAQLAGMQTGTTTTITGPAFVFSGTMRAGMSGPGVGTLQGALNAVQNPDIVVDSKYGPATASAVRQFQASQGLNADGIVGPLTGNALAQASTTVIVIPTGNLPAGCSSSAGYSTTTGVKCDASALPAGCTSTTGYSTTTGNKCDAGVATLPAGCTSADGYSTTTGEKCDYEVSNGGDFPSTDGSEASLGSYKMVGEDDAQEDSMEHVATIEFDVEDGDVKIERLDLTFDNAAVTGGADTRPWDVFRTITLMADGEEIAEMDVDRRSDWNRDDNPFVFRMNNLDYVVERGDLAEIEVHLTSNNTVRDFANADWKIYVANNGIRGVDTAGLTQEIGTASDTVSFSVDAKGGNEALKIKSSSKNPDASVLKVEANEKSDWYDVFVYRLEAEDNDVDVEDVTILLDTTTTTYANAINDVKITIDGKEFKRYTMVDGGACTTQNTSAQTEADCINPLPSGAGTWTADANQKVLTFDVDQEVSIDADEEVDVVVMVEFKKQSGYAGTTTVKATSYGANGEGVDYLNASGSAVGKAHSLALAAAEVTDVTSSSSKSEDEKTGTFVFTFKVTADDGDINVDIANIVAKTIPNNAAATGGVLVSSDAEVNTVGSDYDVLSGTTANFSLSYTYTPAAAGTYYVNLEEVAGVTVNKLAGPQTLKA